ncbi:MAG: SAM-dependent chlorinase/fluorinase [Gammaproteobacteria bacterium]|nr:MAG: SAM-dependent chlorinase/fluorinase [Gammaproteobacteria bacterium]
MILTFTDFGRGGPYLGQMRLSVERHAPGIPVIDLISDLTPFNSRAAAYLLASLSSEIPPGSVLLGIVDPDVGTGSRQPVVMRAADRWYVGPGNGLFSVVAQQYPPTQVWQITWRPSRLSDSFHGRDLFAPVAAMLARGDEVPGEPVDATSVGPRDWPDDLAEIIYLDDFGNAMTGMRASTLNVDQHLEVRGHRVSPAHTFGEAAPGEGFWYTNSCGLAEIAVNQGNAREQFGLRVGDSVGM